MTKAWVCRRCQLPTMDGPICNACNGGRNATPTNPAYSSREYRRARVQLLAAHRAVHGDRCPRCGRLATVRNPLTIDHTQPLSRGGAAAQPGMTVMCKSCNSSLGNRTRPTQQDLDAKRLSRRSRGVRVTW